MATNHDIYTDKTEYVKKEQVKLKEPPIEDLSASEAAAVEKQKVFEHLLSSTDIPQSLVKKCPMHPLPIMFQTTGKAQVSKRNLHPPAPRAQDDDSRIHDWYVACVRAYHPSNALSIAYFRVFPRFSLR